MSKFFDQVYSSEGAEALREVYDAHARTYEAEVAAADYATPGRIAAALAQHVTDKALPALDFACGTGLSGKALNAAGFVVIDGFDVSAGMLAEAQEKGIYRTLIHAAPDDRVPEGYGAAIACGAIGAGAAPVDCLDRVLDALPAGGVFVFSFNDHTLEDPVFTGRLDTLTGNGTARLLFSEHGAHLPAMDMQAIVYVLEKL